MGDAEAAEAASLLPDMFKRPDNLPKPTYNPFTGAFWQYHFGSE